MTTEIAQGDYCPVNSPRMSGATGAAGDAKRHNFKRVNERVHSQSMRPSAKVLYARVCAEIYRGLLLALHAYRVFLAM